MPRYYFHRHLNGMVVRDQSGTSLWDESEACACGSLHAFNSPEIGQPSEEYLPRLGGVGRPTHPVCRERESGLREALRPPQSGGLL